MSISGLRKNLDNLRKQFTRHFKKILDKQKYRPEHNKYAIYNFKLKLSNAHKAIRGTIFFWMAQEIVSAVFWYNYIKS